MQGQLGASAEADGYYERPLVDVTQQQHRHGQLADIREVAVEFQVGGAREREVADWGRILLQAHRAQPLARCA